MGSMFTVLLFLQSLAIGDALRMYYNILLKQKIIMHFELGNLLEMDCDKVLMILSSNKIDKNCLKIKKWWRKALNNINLGLKFFLIPFNFSHFLVASLSVPNFFVGSLSRAADLLPVIM